MSYLPEVRTAVLMGLGFVVAAGCSDNEGRLTTEQRHSPSTVSALLTATIRLAQNGGLKAVAVQEQGARGLISGRGVEWTGYGVATLRAPQHETENWARSATSNAQPSPPLKYIYRVALDNQGTKHLWEFAYERSAPDKPPVRIRDFKNKHLAFISETRYARGRGAWLPTWSRMTTVDSEGRPVSQFEETVSYDSTTSLSLGPSRLDRGLGVLSSIGHACVALALPTVAAADDGMISCNQYYTALSSAIGYYNSDMTGLAAFNAQHPSASDICWSPGSDTSTTCGQYKMWVNLVNADAKKVKAAQADLAYCILTINVYYAASCESQTKGYNRNSWIGDYYTGVNSYACAAGSADTGEVAFSPANEPMTMPDWGGIGGGMSCSSENVWALDLWGDAVFDETTTVVCEYEQ